MNPTYKAKWLEALRSGKYRQGRGALKSLKGFCCLGVLCDVVKEDVEGRWGEVPIAGFIDGDVDRFRFTTPDGYDENYLPFTVREVTGLVRDPEVTPASVTSGGEVVEGKTLAVFNDSGDYTFAQIADMIERDL